MNPEKVSTSTRKKVESAVMETGYAPNSLARNLRRNESKTIVAMVPDVGDPYYSDIIRGVEEAAMEHGYLVLIGDTSQPLSKNETITNLVFTKQADGILLLGSKVPFDVSKAEQKNLPPMVMACEYAPELELPTVHIDNLTAAFDAVNYLTQMGHSRIAQLCGPNHAALSQFRKQGYQQALRRAGISVNPAYTVHSDFTAAGGARAVTALLSQPEPPTAIFCHNDLMAIGAMQQAKRLGFRVPQDLSVIGFDNIDFAELCDPPLTCLAQPRFQIGYQAMLLLLERLKGKEIPAGSRLLDTQVIARESASPRI